MKWIKVDDKTPYHQEEVLITDGDYVDNWFFCESFDKCTYLPNRITHWMPMPEPPKE